MISARRIRRAAVCAVLLFSAGSCTPPQGDLERVGASTAPIEPMTPRPPKQAASGAATSSAAVASASAAPSATGAPDAGEATERVPDIEYVPTPDNVVTKMLEVVKPTKDDLVYDLGCGDGRIVVAAAKKYGAKAVGYDIDPVRVAEARENVKKAGVEHLVSIEQKDIFTLDLSAATVVTLYLLPDLNVRLIPQLEKLRPGARIVSHDFDMQGVEPEAHWTIMAKDHAGPGNRKHYVYFWRTPLKKQ